MSSAVNTKQEEEGQYSSISPNVTEAATIARAQIVNMVLAVDDNDQKKKGDTDEKLKDETVKKQQRTEISVAEGLAVPLAERNSSDDNNNDDDEKVLEEKIAGKNARDHPISFYSNDIYARSPGVANNEQNDEKQKESQSSKAAPPLQRQRQTYRESPMPGAVAVAPTGAVAVAPSGFAAERSSSSGSLVDTNSSGALSLIHAQPVEDDSQQPVGFADPVFYQEPKSNNKKSTTDTPTANQTRQVLLAVGAVTVVSCVILAIAFTQAKGKDDDLKPPIIWDEKSNLTVAPTQSATTKSLGELIGLPETTMLFIEENPDSAQAEAYNWLQNDPIVYTDPEKAVQRYVLATLFFDTGGNGWNLNENWLDYELDECYDWFHRAPIDSENQWAYRRFLQQEGDDTTNTTAAATGHNSTASNACNEEGQYIRMILSGNNLNGKISPEIGLLSKLELLDLSGNGGLEGSLPSELGLLTELRLLSADRNQHTGGIPSEIGLLPKIETIYLEHNPFGGSIPTEMGMLGASLISLTMQRSGLTGHLPSELYHLTKLKELHVQNILGLTGGTLEGIGALTDLESFLAHDVPFNSTIPSEVGLLSNLHSFNLWNTHIYGTLPPEYWKMTNMVNMDIDDNYLSGTFPNELGQFSHLESVWINGNQLSGTLPSKIWENLKNLTYLKMNGNALTGSIPTEVGLLTNMRQIWFADLALSGTIPSEMGGMEALESIFFHLTELEGTIPTELENLEKLELITLSKTSVAGAIPESLCDKLKDMELSCLVVLGVQEQVCTEVEVKNFSCLSSYLCGCDCEPCG